MFIREFVAVGVKKKRLHSKNVSLVKMFMFIPLVFSMTPCLYVYIYFFHRIKLNYD